MSQYTHLAQEDQPTGVNVPVYDAATTGSEGWSSGAVANDVGPTGCSTDSLKRVFVSPYGVLRLLEFLFALVAFGTMADQSHYSDQASFGFLVFTGAVAWLFIMFMLLAHIFDIHSRFSWLYLVEFGLDVLFALFAISAGIAVTYKCNREIGDTGVKFCSEFFKKSRASAAFSFLLGFSMLGSSFFSFKRFRNPPRGGSAQL